MANNLITVGSGNDTIYVDGSIATLMTSAGSSTMSVGMNDTIDAGAGDDIVSVISGSNLYIVGGDGSDSIEVVGDYYSRKSNNITIAGGNGNDSIYNSYSNYASIDGGTGNDSIYNNGGYQASIDGGDGNDSIYNYGDYASINVVNGSDTIYNYGYYASIDGGDGNDSIHNYGYYASIDGGDGDDSIHNRGYYASIDAGDGDDYIYNSYSNYASIDGGNGNDTIGNSYGSFVTIDGGDGNDSIVNWGGDYASIDAGDGDDSVYYDNYRHGSYSSIYGGAGNDYINSSGDYSKIYGDSGNDIIRNNGIYSTIDGGDGNDSLLNDGGNFISMYGGNGNDTIKNTGINDTVFGRWEGNYVLIDAGDGNDYIQTKGDYATIDAGSGNDFIDNMGGNHLTINGGIGEDVIINGNYYLTSGFGLVQSDSISIDGGEGNDYIFNNGLYATISGGTGNDAIINGEQVGYSAMSNSAPNARYANIDAGDGDDSIRNVCSNVTINAGSGNDSIVNITLNGFSTPFRGSQVVIDAGAGNDYIENIGVEYTTIDAGDGNDSIYNDGDSYSRYSTINAGSGNDYIYNNSNGVTLNGGAGIDTIYGHDSRYETFIHTADTDIIFGFDSSDRLSIESGIITSSISSGSDVILMTSNNGSIILKNTALGNIVFNDGWIGYQIVSGTDSTGSNSTGSDSTGSNSTGSNSAGSDSAGSNSTGSNSTGSNSTGSISISNDSNDTIYVDTSIETIISGSNSNITPLHSSVIDAGSGNDRIEIIDGVNLSIVGGSGNDYIQNISGNLVTINGGIGKNTLVGANSESDLFVYDGGRDLIKNFYIGDSLDFGSHTISSSVVSDNGITFRFDNHNSLNVTIEGVGSENLNIDGGVITYVASEDTNYESIEIFGSEIGSDSPMIIDNSDGMTRRTIIRFTGDNEMISVESNFRTDDIKFVFYDSEGALHTQPYRGSETRAFVALNSNNAEFVANPNSTENLNYGFGTEGSIDNWNVSLGAGNDMIHIDDVASGNFDGGSGVDYFHVTKNLNSDVSLTGGNDTLNLFYATSGVVSNKSDQAIITITDINFDLGDVILVDAGVANLTGDFFSEGKFYNFSNARQASTSGAIVRNIFDATDIIENLEMEFSMAKFANRSEMPTGSDLSKINSTSVIWVNDESTVIELENQTDAVLVFTDSNDFGDELYLGSNFDDTIHAGVNDTIDAGGGNDQIYVGSSTNVIYSDGNDTIMNWNSSAIVDLNELVSMPSISLSGNNLLIGSTTINEVSGSDIQYRFDDEIGIVRVASNGSMKYGSEITYYAGSTLILDTDENIVIDLSESTYENISMIEAGNGSGADRFIYESGNVTIRNGDSTDVIELSNYSFDEVNREFTGSGLILTMNNSSLNIEGTSLTTFYFSDGVQTADFTNQTF